MLIGFKRCIFKYVCIIFFYLWKLFYVYPFLPKSNVFVATSSWKKSKVWVWMNLNWQSVTVSNNAECPAKRYLMCYIKLHWEKKKVFKHALFLFWGFKIPSCNVKFNISPFLFDKGIISAYISIVCIFFKCDREFKTRGPLKFMLWIVRVSFLEAR